MKRTLTIATLALAIGACSPSADRSRTNETLSQEAGDIKQPPAQSDLPIPPADTASDPVVNDADDAGSEPSGPQSALAIPAQYRGRWGMVPADCEPGRADAKGLMTVGDKTLRFYESVGALQEQRPAIATSFAGLYSFTGEGQSWERSVVLTRDGDTLTRAEDDRSYTYKRCP